MVISEQAIINTKIDLHLLTMWQRDMMVLVMNVHRDLSLTPDQCTEIRMISPRQMPLA